MVTKFSELNQLLQDNFSIGNSKKLVTCILEIMGINNLSFIYTQNSLRKITDTTKKSMFVDDNEFADFKAAYDISSSHYDINVKFKQLILPRLFVIKQYSRSNIIWLNKLGINYEDDPLINGFKPLGLDFVVCKDRLLVVVSNQDNLRVLELNQGEDLNSTQTEILSNWQNLFAIETNKKLLHSKLWDSLNLESVNKKFYIDIIQSFANLKQHLTDNELFGNNQAVIFTNRLIGRLLFCYFLIKKGFIPAEYLELDGQNDNDYYHNKLSQLFFAVLNTPINERNHDDISTPYLNGGLFERKDTDIDNVTFPNNYFNNLFTIFRKYNWTVDESLSNYEVMAIDPEMLGRIFENLLAEINVDNDGSSESARKAKGAFYTPRVIVDYMCKESLRQYLQTNSPEHSHNIINRLLDDSIGYLTDQKKNWTDDIKPYKEHLISLLDKITVFDPACGSGAFPMGMLQLILHTYERLGDKLKPNHRKIKIIENSIFGADIEPNAIEIARLRAWLSIIVDEDKQAIEPLPNLDFKFVCCNSLIKLERQGQSNLADNIGTVEKLQELQHKYFRARTYKNKQDIRGQYHDLIEQSRSQNSLFGKSKYLEQIESYHPFNTQNICQFYDNEFMFGIKDGFDVVIGNPPYGANIDNYLEYYKQIYPKLKQGHAEVYKFFFGVGVNVLNQNGVLSYITPNTFINMPKYKALRKFLIDHVEIIINLGLGIFSDAVVPVAITLANKNKNSTTLGFADLTNSNYYNGNINSYHDLNIIDLSIIKNNKDLEFFSSYTSGNYLTFNDVFTIKDAGVNYQRIGCGLGDKGNNDLYDRLFSNDISYFNNIKSIYYGKLINRYFMEKSSNLYFNLDYASVLKTNEVVSTPVHIFNVSPKIIWRQTANRLQATIDESKNWFMRSIHACFIKDEFKEKVDIKFALAIINSKYIAHLYNCIVNENGRVFPQIKLTHVKKIQFKIATEEVQQIFVKLVDEIFKTKENGEDVNGLEKQIDQLVYELYDLTPEEIALIESK